MATLLLLIAPLLQADDAQRWIKELGDESIEVRETASGRLRGLGEPILPRLEKAEADATLPEVKARLSAIIDGIRKDAEFAKVFGPTRRVTLNAQDRRLGDVLQELAKSGSVTMGPGELDPGLKITVDLKNVTWWEAVDRTVQAAGAKYEFEHLHEPPHLRIDLKRGLNRPLPRVYQDQFRIGVVEAKRLDFVAPGRKESVVMIMIEALHQPNLKPSSETFKDPIQVKSIKDAKGADPRVEHPDWTGGTFMNSRLLGIYLTLWVKADAAFPLTLEAVVDVPFPKDSREVTLPIAESEPAVKVGAVTMSIMAFTRGKSGIRFKVKAEAEGDQSLMSSLKDDTVFVIDSKGKRHEACSGGRSASEGEAEFEFSLEDDVPDAKEVVFRWVGDYHRVAIPFRLEGIDLPK